MNQQFHSFIEFGFKLGKGKEPHVALIEALKLYPKNRKNILKTPYADSSDFKKADKYLENILQKKCKKCGNIHYYVKYWKNKNTADGRSKHCETCDTELQRDQKGNSPRNS